MKTLKKILCLMLALSTVFFTFSCVKDDTTPSGDEQQDSTTITVTDHLGIEITVPKEINRIVIGDIYPLASVISIFFDSAEKIVGMPIQCMSAAKNSLLSELYPEILDAETGYINGTTVNIEELLLLEPDVVFYSSGTPQLGEQLNNAGIPAIAISASNWNYNAIETLENWIALLSEMFESNDKKELVKSYSEKVLERVKEKTATLSEEEIEDIFFLFQYNENSITTSGKRFFGQWWADAINAKNVGEELEKDYSTAVNMEQVYKWNPDCILVTNFNTASPDDLYNNTVGSFDWSEIDAIKNKRVYKMPLGMYRSYTCGVDTPVTLLWVAKTVYPELFADVDITSEVQNYYSEVFGIELTREQAEKIFAPSSDAAAFN